MKAPFRKLALWRFFDQKEKWTQGATARNKAGRMTEFNNPDAAQFCLYGAVCKLARLSDRRSWLDRIEKVAGQPTITFNDNFESFRQFRAALKKAGL